MAASPDRVYSSQGRDSVPQTSNILETKWSIHGEGMLICFFSFLIVTLLFSERWRKLRFSIRTIYHVATFYVHLKKYQKNLFKNTSFNLFETPQETHHAHAHTHRIHAFLCSRVCSGNLSTQYRNIRLCLWAGRPATSPARTSAPPTSVPHPHVCT